MEQNIGINYKELRGEENEERRYKRTSRSQCYI